MNLVCAECELESLVHVLWECSACIVSQVNVKFLQMGWHKYQERQDRDALYTE